MLDFSPENKSYLSFKRKQYAIENCLNESDMEALVHRFESSNVFSDFEFDSHFKEKLDATDFARCFKDIHSILKNAFYLIFSWAVLMHTDESGEEWRYVRHEISKAIKQMSPSFLQQLNIQIKALKQSLRESRIWRYSFYRLLFVCFWVFSKISIKLCVSVILYYPWTF